MWAVWNLPRRTTPEGLPPSFTQHRIQEALPTSNSPLRSGHKPGGREEPPLPAPTDPYVSLSTHTALVILITRLAGPKEPTSSARTNGDVSRQPLASTSWLSSWPAAVCISCESSAQGRR